MQRSEIEKLGKALTPKLTKYIPHTPYVKQQVFMLLECEEAFYGGAAGGGKSDALLMCALQYVDTPGYSAIIFRKTFADLVKPGALIDRAKEWLAPFINAKEVRWVEKDKKFVFPSGAILQFGYMENYNDRLNYQGGEYQFVGWDEVTHIKEGCYKYMFSRMRKLKGVQIPLRVRAASNPPDDEDDSEWVYNRFVNPETKLQTVPYIPAGIADNPHLDKESYIKNLNKMDPVTRARLRDGLWTVQRKGNMFKQAWFEVVDELPPNRRKLRFWDCAATEVEPQQKKRGKDPDYTVGFLLSEWNGVFYIEHIYHKRVSALAVEQAQIDHAKMDGPWTRIREEEEGGSSGKFTTAKKKKETFFGYAYEGVRNTGSKIERAKAASAAAERGLIKIYSKCPHQKELFQELETFPSAPHDDLVDGLSGAYNNLAGTPQVFAPMGVGNQDSHWEGVSMSNTVENDKVIPLHTGLMASGSYWRG